MRKWTLSECIEEAKQKSLQSANARLNEASARNSLQASWWDLAPTISAHGSHGYSFGRTIDYSSNSKVSADMSSMNFSIGADLTIFQGLSKWNQIRANRLSLRAEEARTQALEYQLTAQVAQAYLNLLYQESLCRTRSTQLETAKAQVKLAEKRAAAGVIAKGAVLELQSQEATEELSLVEAENAAAIARITLLQLMSAEDMDTIALATPSLDSSSIPPLPNYSTKRLYEEAAAAYPTIKAAKLSEALSERKIGLALAGYSPRISFRVNYGTGGRQYIGKELKAMNRDSYAEQFKLNATTNVQFSVMIPIFDGLATNARVQEARIMRDRYKIETEKAERELYNLLQKAWGEAQSAFKQYQSAKKSVEALRENARWAEQKHAVGTMSSYEYTLARSKLSMAETTLLQNQYLYIFKLKLLDLYRGQALDL